MLKLMPALAATGLLVSGVAHAEGTLFDRTRAFFEQASMPVAAHFQADAMWAGKCVFGSDPDRAYPGVLHVNYEAPDPLSDGTLRLLSSFDPSSTLDYVRMPVAEAQRMHNDYSRYASFYTLPSGFTDPLATSLTFSYRAGATINDMAVRSGTTRDDQPMQVQSIACGTESCRDLNGHQLRRGEIAMYCYYWVDRLATPPTSFDAMDPAAE